MLELTVKVWGIMQSVLKRKEKGCCGKDLQKRFLFLLYSIVHCKIKCLKCYSNLYVKPSIAIMYNI